MNARAVLTALVLLATWPIAGWAQVPNASAAPAPAAKADTSRTAVDETQTEIETQKKELESLGRELQERRAKSQQLRGRERNLLGELKEKEVQLSLTIRYLPALEKRRRIVSSDLGSATTELALTGVRLDSDRRRLSWRLREIYKRVREETATARTPQSQADPLRRSIRAGWSPLD